MPEIRINEGNLGQTRLSMTVDERASLLLRGAQEEAAHEQAHLFQTPSAAARGAAYELGHIINRLAEIAHALEEGRLVITEPTEETLAARANLEMELFMSPDPAHFTAPEPEAGPE